MKRKTVKIKKREWDSIKNKWLLETLYETEMRIWECYWGLRSFKTGKLYKSKPVKCKAIKFKPLKVKYKYIKGVKVGVI